MAVSVFSEGSDKGREIGGVPGWDLGGDRKMLQAIRPDGAGRVTPKDLTDPSFPCT